MQICIIYKQRNSTINRLCQKSNKATIALINNKLCASLMQKAVHFTSVVFQSYPESTIHQSSSFPSFVCSYLTDHNKLLTIINY